MKAQFSINDLYESQRGINQRIITMNYRSRKWRCMRKMEKGKYKTTKIISEISMTNIARKVVTNFLVKIKEVLRLTVGMKNHIRLNKRKI